MAAHRDQIRARLAAFAGVEIDGVTVGEISPSAASVAAGEAPAFFTMLLEPRKDPRTGTLARAADRLGVSHPALIDPDADMGDLETWPPPNWLSEIAKRQTSDERRRHDRIARAIEAGRRVGVCTNPECGREDSLVGKDDLCQACYQRNRRAAQRNQDATSHPR